MVRILKDGSIQVGILSHLDSPEKEEPQEEPKVEPVEEPKKKRKKK
mgnify:CR=1 FL=1